jgi:hypothetical protein
MRGRKSKPPVVVALRPELSEDAVAERAYYIWEARNCPVTDGTDEWFAARAELERESRAPARAKSKRVTA